MTAWMSYKEDAPWNVTRAGEGGGRCAMKAGSSFSVCQFSLTSVFTISGMSALLPQLRSAAMNLHF